MGFGFLKLDKLEEARICFEQFVAKMGNGEPWLFDFQCQACIRGVPPGVAYICPACADNIICSECYAKRATGFQPKGCDMTHQYIEIGGEKWKALADGQVSEGETLEQWLHRQRQVFGVELSAHSNQT